MDIVNELKELLAKGESIANEAINASKGENIAVITDSLVQLASVSATINIALFKAQSQKERAKAEAETRRVEAEYADMEAGGSMAHAAVVGKVKAIPLLKAHRVADEHYRYVKTYRDNYQVIIEVLRSRVSALKSEQKNL